MIPNRSEVIRLLVAAAIMLFAFPCASSAQKTKKTIHSKKTIQTHNRPERSPTPPKTSGRQTSADNEFIKNLLHNPFRLCETEVFNHAGTRNLQKTTTTKDGTLIIGYINPKNPDYYYAIIDSTYWCYGKGTVRDKASPDKKCVPFDDFIKRYDFLLHYRPNKNLEIIDCGEICDAHYKGNPFEYHYVPTGCPRGFMRSVGRWYEKKSDSTSVSTLVTNNGDRIVSTYSAREAYSNLISFFDNREPADKLSEIAKNFRFFDKRGNELFYKEPAKGDSTDTDVIYVYDKSGQNRYTYRYAGGLIREHLFRTQLHPQGVFIPALPGDSIVSETSDGSVITRVYANGDRICSASSEKTYSSDKAKPISGTLHRKNALIEFKNDCLDAYFKAGYFKGCYVESVTAEMRLLDSDFLLGVENLEEFIHNATFYDSNKELAYIPNNYYGPPIDHRLQKSMERKYHLKYGSKYVEAAKEGRLLIGTPEAMMKEIFEYSLQSTNGSTKTYIVIVAPASLTEDWKLSAVQDFYLSYNAYKAYVTCRNGKVVRISAM